MSTGILARGTLGALTSVYTCPANTTAFITVNIANRSGSTITASINLSTNASENLGGYVEFSSSIAANQTLEKTGIVLQATQQLLISGSSTNGTFVIFGYERAL